MSAADSASRSVVLVVGDAPADAPALAGRPALQHTLDRAARVPGTAAVVRVPQNPHDPGPLRCAAARRWARAAWRGGLGGATVWDELLPAAPLVAALAEHDAQAAVLVGAGWCAFDPHLAGRLQQLHRSAPEAYGMTFTQAPPGLSALVVGRPLLEAMARSDATFGGALAYRPSRPALDPIGREVNLPIGAALRDTARRFVFDTPEAQRRLAAVADALGPGFATADAEAVAAAARAAEGVAPPDAFDDLPEELVIELTTRRLARGPATPQHHADLPDVDLDADLALAVAAQCRGRLVTFGGLGDPVLHPRFADVVRAAQDAGAAGIHVVTDLLGPKDHDHLLTTLPLDVVSVRLNADTAATYARLMGIDAFADVMRRLQGVFDARSASPRGAGLPWVIPRLLKTTDNLADLETFFDRWMHHVGHAVIDRAPRGGCGAGALMPDLGPVPMDPPWTDPAPGQVKRRLHVRAGGAVTLCEQDWRARAALGHTRDAPLVDLWAGVNRVPLHDATPDHAPVCRRCLAWWRLRTGTTAADPAGPPRRPMRTG